MNRNTQEDIRKEAKAWKDMCNEIQKVMKITKKEFNELKFKPLVIAIERWAYYDRIRRFSLEIDGSSDKYDDYGIFFKGEKK